MLRNADEPLYAQIESVLSSEFADGTLPAGVQIPTEDQLIARFKMSRITVRRAVQNLVNRGLVEIRRGRGTFVTQPRITQGLTELTGFVEDMQALGRRASARLIDKRIVNASEIVARQLSLMRGRKVVRLQRVRLADNLPVSFDETYLPLEIGKKIITNDLEKEPVFSLLEQKYKIPLLEAEYRLEAVAAEADVAEALEITQGSPIFRIERTSYTTGGTPIDYERLHYRGDLVRFVTRLSRSTAK
jgi:GntR family transcriptional regulator